MLTLAQVSWSNTRNEKAKKSIPSRGEGQEYIVLIARELQVLFKASNLSLM